MKQFAKKSLVHFIALINTAALSAKPHKYIFNCLVIKIFILCHEQLHDLHAALLAQIEFTVCVSILASLFCCTTERIVGVFLIQPVIFIKYRNSRSLNRRNTSELSPQTFEMILHLSSATHYITSCRIINSISCTACNIHSLKYVHIHTHHLSISYKKARCS